MMTMINRNEMKLEMYRNVKNVRHKMRNVEWEIGGECVGISANSQLMRLQSGRPTSQALLYCWLVRPTTEIKNTNTNIILSASTITNM